jgi:hypothetical protein
MTSTLRDRLAGRHTRSASALDEAAPIDMAAAAHARSELSILAVDSTSWTVFGRVASQPEWLGDIDTIGDRFVASHGTAGRGYSFLSFAEAVSYFTEYALALRLCLPD